MTSRLRTAAIAIALIATSLFFVFLLISSFSSGCTGDVIGQDSCRPDPLMKTYDASGHEVSDTSRNAQ